MSASESDLTKQRRRHRGPLLGIAAVLVFAGVLMFSYFTFLAEDGTTPQDTGAQIDGRTGDETGGTTAADLTGEGGPVPADTGAAPAATGGQAPAADAQGTTAAPTATAPADSGITPVVPIAPVDGEPAN